MKLCESLSWPQPNPQRLRKITWSFSGGENCVSTIAEIPDRIGMVIGLLPIPYTRPQLLEAHVTRGSVWKFIMEVVVDPSAGDSSSVTGEDADSATTIIVVVMADLLILKLKNVLVAFVDPQTHDPVRVKSVSLEEFLLQRR